MGFAGVNVEWLCIYGVVTKDERDIWRLVAASYNCWTELRIYPHCYLDSLLLYKPG